jgi:hypothetical protein
VKSIKLFLMGIPPRLNGKPAKDNREDCQNWQNRRKKAKIKIAPRRHGNTPKNRGKRDSKVE